MSDLKRILLAEDSPYDVELILTALDCRSRRGNSKLRAEASPRSVPVVVPTPCREEQDLVRSYPPGVNACPVEPVDCHELVGAIEQPGLFRAAVDELPPGSAPAPIQ